MGLTCKSLIQVFMLTALTPASLTSALDEFVKSLRRHISLIPLIKSCSLILSQPLTLRKMVLDLKRIDFSPIHEDVNLLIEQECLNEVRGLISFFACESEGEEEETVTMNSLSLHVKESVERFVLRNEVRTDSHAAASALDPLCYRPSLL